MTPKLKLRSLLSFANQQAFSARIAFGAPTNSTYTSTRKHINKIVRISQYQGTSSSNKLLILSLLYAVHRLE